MFIFHMDDNIIVYINLQYIIMYVLKKIIKFKLNLNLFNHVLLLIFVFEIETWETELSITSPYANA